MRKKRHRKKEGDDEIVDGRKAVELDKKKNGFKSCKRRDAFYTQEEKR